MSSWITWVQGSCPCQGVLISLQKSSMFCSLPALLKLVIINWGKKPPALCCLMDIALPWTCSYLFPRELVFLAIDSCWVALLVFLPLFYYSSTFGLAAFFQSVAVLCWSCLSCLVFSRLLCCCCGCGGMRSCRAAVRGRVHRASNKPQQQPKRWEEGGGTEVKEKSTSVL